MHLLVVDDEDAIGFMINQFLKKEHNLRLAHSYSEAIRLISSEAFDLFILDVHLPDGNGLSLIPEIRKHDSKARILTMSAYDDYNNDHKLKETGADMFLSKPFTKKEILDSVDKLLS